MGEKIPATFDKSTEYTQHIEPVVENLLALAKEHGIALLVTATTRRTITSDDGESFDESCSQLSRGVNIAQHSYALMVGAAVTDMLMTHEEVLHDPDQFRNLCTGAVLSVQTTISEIVSGDAEYVIGVNTNNETHH